RPPAGEGDLPPPPPRARPPPPPPPPPRRPREDGAHRLGRRRSYLHQATARLHDADTARDSDRQRPQVAGHDRTDIRVHHRRAQALVLTVLVDQAVRGRDVHPPAGQRPTETPLAPRRRVAVQQTDRHRRP